MALPWRTACACRRPDLPGYGTLTEPPEADDPCDGYPRFEDCDIPPNQRGDWRCRDEAEEAAKGAES